MTKVTSIPGYANKYTKEKRVLKDDETFYEEHTDFVYYINADKLIYSYAYFFKEDAGFINNDWRTIRLIDENEKAVKINN